MTEELRRSLSEVARLCRTYGVRSLAVFGSAARGDFDPLVSDVDLLVEFDDLPPARRAACFFDLLEALEALLGRPVDLVEAAAVHNPYVRQDIEASKVVVYEAA